jgi:hypothetical protein
MVENGTVHAWSKVAIKENVRLYSSENIWEATFDDPYELAYVKHTFPFFSKGLHTCMACLRPTHAHNKTKGVHHQLLVFQKESQLIKGPKLYGNVDVQKIWVFQNLSFPHDWMT